MNESGKVDDDWDDLAFHLQQLENEACLSEDENIAKSLELANEAILTAPESVPSSNSCTTIVDQSWELIDPTPDLRALFLEFNEKYFWGALERVEVRWSPRMTYCAGLCVYEGKGGLCSVRLSEPLLKLRPRKDMIETLLDHDAHGPEFHYHMRRLNELTSTNITVYHSFHDEVANYQQHWWRCDGPCQRKHPYYGYVKRAMNRAPSAKDPWWAEHQSSCGGTYTKIKEPEGYSKRKAAKDSKPAAKVDGVRSKDIRNMMITGQGKIDNSSNGNESSAKTPDAKLIFSTSSGHTLGGSSATSTGPLVRNLPGVGLIVSERSITSCNSTSAHNLHVHAEAASRVATNSNATSVVKHELIDLDSETKKREVAASTTATATKERLTSTIPTGKREEVLATSASTTEKEGFASNISAVNFKGIAASNNLAVKLEKATTSNASVAKHESISLSNRFAEDSDKKTNFKHETDIFDNALQQFIANQSKNKDVASTSNGCSQKQQFASDRDVPSDLPSVNKRKRASWGDEMEDRAAKRLVKDGVVRFSKFPSVSDIKHLKMGESFKVSGSGFVSVASPKYKEVSAKRERQRALIGEAANNRNTRALSLNDFEEDDDIVDENKPIAAILNKQQTTQAPSSLGKTISSASAAIPAETKVKTEPKPADYTRQKPNASSTSAASHASFTDVQDDRRSFIECLSDDEEDSNLVEFQAAVSNRVEPGASTSKGAAATNDVFDIDSFDNADQWVDEATVPCPVCQEHIIERFINEHLDHCLA